MTSTEREDLMVRVYGEVCTRTEAGRILGGRDIKTVAQMLEDGRLDAACEGTRVDVRSIARYIMSPKQQDSDARERRRVQRMIRAGETPCKWRV